MESGGAGGRGGPDRGKGDRPPPEGRGSPSGALEATSRWVDEHKRAVSLGLKAAAFVGLATALHSVRAFSRFTKASQVPADLVRRSVVLGARARRVDLVKQEGRQGLFVTLFVEHRPLIPLPSSPSPFQSQPDGSLRVEVNSVRVDPAQEGTALRTLRDDFETEGRVRLCLLEKKNSLIDRDKKGEAEEEEEVLSCIVFRKQNFLRSANVGVKIVGEGLATTAEFDPDLADKKAYRKYYQSLLAAEDRALKRGVGMWEPPEDGRAKDSFLRRLKRRFFGR